MATKKTTDITKQGPQSYRELQQANADAFTIASAQSPFVELKPQRGIVSSKDFIYEGEEMSPMQLTGRGYWGNSMFDEAQANEEDYQDNLSNIRAQNQPWYAQLGAGLGKGVALAATTWLDGTVGLVAGIAEMPKKGISALWDNEVSNTLASANRQLEEWLPNYMTEAEQENAWYENLGTMNFWANGVLKNLGFAVGAFYSGATWTKALKAVGLIKGAMGAKTVGSVLSALNEGRIEANNTVHDINQLYDQQINDARDRRRNEILSSDLSDEDKMYALQELADNTVKLREEAKDKADAVGLTTFIGNTVLLSLDNFAEFGKLYARGFKNARGLASNISKAAEEEAIEQAGKNVLKQGNRYAWRDISKKEALMKGLKNGLLEGNEEMSQAFIASTAGYMQEYDSPDAYYNALTDPKSQRKTKDFLSAVTQGFKDTYGNGDRWEEFAVGAFTGLLGMPTFGKVHNSDAITYLGKGRSVGLSGGLFGEISYANQQNREGRAAVDAMNKYMDKLQNHSKYFVQSQSFTDAMDGWAEADNAFEYKNAEDNDDFTAISRFAQTGKLNDLKELVKQDFENISDEELASIAMYTSPNVQVGADENVITSKDDGSPQVGGWRNSDGTLMSDTEEGRTQMRKELSNKRDKILSEIDKYEKSVEAVRALGNNSLNEDQVNELAWLNWKVGMFTDRYNSIKSENQEFLRNLENGVQNFLNGEGREAVDEESEDGKKIISAVENSKKFLNYLTNSTTPLQLSSMLKANPNILEGIEEFIYPMLEDIVGVDNATFEKSMKDLKDAAKIASAADTFNQRYKEFAKDPIKLIQNREKIDSNKRNVNKATESVKLKDKVNNAEVSDIVKGMQNGELQQDELDGLFSDEDTAFLNNIKAGEEGEQTAPTGKQKVEEAKKIIKTKEKVDKAIDALEDDPSIDAQELADAHALLEQSMYVSNSEQEMLDTARQAFNDPNNLYDESLAALGQDEVAEVLEGRLEKAKSIIERVKGSITEAREDLGNISAQNLKEGRSLGEELVQPKTTETGHDSVAKTVTENERQRAIQARAEQEKKVNDRQEKIASLFADLKEGLSDEDKAIFDKALGDVIQGIDMLIQADASDKQISEGTKDTQSYEKLKSLAPDIDARLDVYTTSRRAFVHKQNTNQTEQKTTKEGEDNLPTPEVTSEEIANYASEQMNQDPNKGELEGSYQYWKPTITYLPIHNPKGNLVPFYKLARNMKYPSGAPMFTAQQINRIEKVGKYLEEHGAFNLVDRGEVKVGDTVHFTIDKALSDDVGELVILMTDDQGRVIGDVMSLNDPTFSRQVGLSTLVQNIKEEYTAAGTPDTFTSGLTTKVDKNMVGKVPYLANHDTMNTLNAVHNNGKEKIPFTLGIALTSGSNARILATAGRTKRQGASQLERTINPPVRAKAGQIFLLMPTSSSKNHFIPVPIMMDSYSTETKNTALGMAIRNILEMIPQSGDKEVMKIKNGLEELLSVKEIHINYTDNSVKVTIKPHGAEHQRVIYNGDKNNPTIVDQIEYGLQVQKLPFQVSRKYINDTYGVQSYNEMIGEIAKVNLPIGYTHTVSDWFTIKPLDAKGNTIKTKSPRSTGQNPNSSVVRTIEIPYTTPQGNIALSVDTTTWEVSDGKQVYTGEKANKVKAQAYGMFTNKNMQEPYDTEWGYYDPKTNKFIEKPNRVLKTLGELQQDTVTKSITITNPHTKQSYTIRVGETRRIDDGMYPGVSTIKDIQDDGTIVDSYYDDTSGTTRTRYLTQDQYLTELSYTTLVTDPSTTTQTSSVDTKTKESTSPSKKELNKNEPSTIEERIIIRTSNNGGYQAFGFDPNKGGDKNNTRAMEFWKTRVDTRNLRNPETGNTVQADTANVYIPLKDGTSVITHFHDKEGRAFGRRDGTGINVWRHLTPEEVKEIQEGLLNNEFRTAEEIAKFVDKVLHKESPSAESKTSETSTTAEMVQEETPAQLEDRAKKAGLLGNKVRQAAWKVLTPEQQSTIVNKKGPKQKQWMEMLENAFNPTDNTFDEVKLKGSVDDMLNRKALYRRDSDTEKVWDEQKELSWMKQALPNLSDSEHLKIIEGVRKLATDDGGYAYGKFQNGVITLAGKTARGTLYHEAFHAVAHTLLDSEEFTNLMDAAKEKWGDLSDLELEEKLAEDFRRYVQLEETPVLGTAIKIYRALKHFVQNLIGNEPYINKLYYDINRGNLANRIANQSEITRYQMAPNFRGTVQEFQDIVDSLVNNPTLRLNRVGMNKRWGTLTDDWFREGYIVKGYFNKQTGKWTVASSKKSDIANNSTSYYRKVEQHYRDKMMYNRLTQEDRDYLNERGISIDEYNKMTQLEKEVLFHCKY